MRTFFFIIVIFCSSAAHSLEETYSNSMFQTNGKELLLPYFMKHKLKTLMENIGDF